jgi:hypothetical protein
MVGGAVRAGSSGRGGVGYQILAVLLTYFSICANYMPDIFVMLRDEFQQRDDSGGSAATQPTTTVASAATMPASAPVEAASATATTAPAAADEKPGAGMLIVGIIALLLLMFIISLAAPFFGGSIIGLLIVAFALWEAWKINKRHDANLTGPYALAAGPPPSPAQPDGT